MYYCIDTLNKQVNEMKHILLMILEAIGLIILWTIIIGALYFIGTFEAKEFLLWRKLQV